MMAGIKYQLMGNHLELIIIVKNAILVGDIIKLKVFVNDDSNKDLACFKVDYILDGVNGGCNIVKVSPCV